MQVKVAKNAGFCFGVRRAVQTVFELLESEPNATIYTMGKLIHNRLLVEELESKGVVTLKEDDDLKEVFSQANESTPAVIVLRAHGIPLDLEEKIKAECEKNPYVKMVDCTCPYVKNIHKTVEKYATKDRTLVIAGDPCHPEVKGIRSYAKGNVEIYNTLEAMQSANFHEKHIIMVAQTTQNLTELEKMQKFLQNTCKSPLICDTICNVTEIRQTETAALAKEVDCMLVIGGKDSSNTKKLYEISKTYQPNTFFLESVADFPVNTVQSHWTVGVTAGASTPDGTIEEVKKYVTKRNP